MELKSYLLNIGLSEKAVSIYLACVKLKQSHIVPIARQVGLPRTTVLQILEKLERQGLIEIDHQATRRTYSARAPRAVLNLLQRRQQEAEQAAQAFAESLPELNQLYTVTPFEPQARFYRGQSEMRQVLEGILDSQVKEYWYLAEETGGMEALGEQWMNSWVKRRINLGIKAKAIWVKVSDRDNPLYGHGTEYLRELRFAPTGFKAPAEIIIYGDNVAIVSSAQETIAILITSRDYAETMRSWFQALWEQSNPA